MKDAVNVALQLKSDKLREEAQAENQDFLNSLDSNMKKTIKEQVKAQTSKIMTKVEKYVTETLGAEVLVRLTDQPQTSYVVASSLSELELKKILMDKWRKINLLTDPMFRRISTECYSKHTTLTKIFSPHMRRRSGKEESSKEITQKASNSTSSSKGATKSPPKSSAKSSQEEEHEPRVADLEEPLHQDFNIGNDASLVREGKLTNLSVDERFALNVALRMYTRRIIIQERVEDLQLAALSLQDDMDKKSFDAPDGTHKQEVDAKSRKVYWWKTLQRRPLATTKDHMILSYDVLIIQVKSGLWEDADEIGANTGQPNKVFVMTVSISIEGLWNEKEFKDKGEKKEALRTLRKNRVIHNNVKNLVLSDIIKDSHGPSDAMYNPSQPLKVRKTLFQNSWRFTHFYQLSHSELVDIEKNIRVISFTMKMEILLESTSKKLMVGYVMIGGGLYLIPAESQDSSIHHAHTVAT
ncbi:hypothetical protein Tco_1449838 [Tanacetum coccineum]